MSIPVLNLLGHKYDEVPNEVVRFLENHLTGGSYADIITGKNDRTIEKVVEIVKQYKFEYLTGLPHFQGKVRVIMIDFESEWGSDA